MKKIIILVVVLIAMSFLYAQNENPLTRSYNYETNYQYTAALEAMHSLIKSDPNNAFYNIRLGWLSYLSADYVSAKNYYEKAYKMDKSTEALEGLNLVAYYTADWDKVIKYSDEVLKKYPYDFTALGYKAYAFFLKGDWTKAAKVYTKILTRYPYHIDSRCYLLGCYTYSSDFMKAKTQYEFVKKYAPSSKYLSEYEAAIKK